MFLSPEVIIVSEFPRDSLEERQPPANTLFSTYFDTVDVFSLSRALSHSHDFRIVVETTRNSVFVQCLIRGELKFESNYFFHCAIKYSKIRRLRFYDRVECAKFFSFVRKRETQLTEICVRKLSCTKFHGSRAWPGFALRPPTISRDSCASFATSESTKFFEAVRCRRYEISVNNLSLLSLDATSCQNGPTFRYY